MTARFRAPWGRELIVTSAIGLLVMGIPIAVQLSSGFWLVSGILAILLTVVACSCVRGYEVAPGELRILRLLWTTRWALDPTVRAVARPHAMEGSWRVWGNGGMFAITGRFSGSGLGRYVAFVTDPARTVVLETPRGTVVVSPDDPAAFVEAAAEASQSARG
jgi:hypothetical protein